MAGTEEDSDSTYEELAHQQQLKAATHYTVGQICENARVHAEINFNQQFIAALSETTFKYISTVATDLEAFAKHAKRSTINADDVKLLTRKSPELNEHITTMASMLSTVNEKKKATTKQRRPKKSTAASTSNQAAVTDDDSNL